MDIAQRFTAGFAALLIAGAVQATPLSTDNTDLWYNPGESGWGLSLYQQEATIFAVLFVYGTNNQPTWYVASSLTWPGTGALAFSGPLYQTNGPWFGAGTFNPAAVGVRQVGTATFTVNDLTTGTFAYSVDGVPVTKAVTRQTWAVNNMSGSFVGGQSGTYANCPGLASGTRDEPGTLAVNHGANGVAMTLATAASNCSFNAAYAQGGHYGFLSGTFSCSDGRSGNFSAFAIDAQIHGLSGRIDTLAGNGCRYTGRIGGIRAF